MHNRFFCPPKNIQENKILIDDSQAVNHIKNVLRLKINDEISVFDGAGYEYACRIEDMEKDGISLNIKDKQKRQAKSKFYLAIACAIPKRAKFDEIVEKLTQLGVDEIIPLDTQRTIAKKDNLARWQKIAINAAEQSQRLNLPQITALQKFKDVILRAREFDLALIPTLEGKRELLHQVLSDKKIKKILVFIGPEGDFSPKELDLAKKAGCLPVTLGDLVLRVDTAAIFVASILRYENI